MTWLLEFCGGFGSDNFPWRHSIGVAVCCYNRELVGNAARGEQNRT